MGLPFQAHLRELIGMVAHSTDIAIEHTKTNVLNEISYLLKFDGGRCDHDKHVSSRFLRTKKFTKCVYGARALIVLGPMETQLYA